ncbi:MAG: hypothetical protein ACOY90_12040 [Candidatus Zhuqueibacterota bacterium]
MHSNLSKHFLGIVLGILVSWPLFAGESVVEIRDIEPNQFVSRSFAVTLPSDFTLHAVVGYYKNPKNILSNCWLLCSETREVVWKFSPSSADVNRSRDYLELEETVHLDIGEYELYYAIDPAASRFKDKIFGLLSGNRERRNPDSKKWGVTLSARQQQGTEAVLRLHDAPRRELQAIVHISQAGDDSNLNEGFILTAPLKVRIYAIGEGTHQGREMYDFGWILNSDSGERVWEMAYRKSQHAGGALKNRLFDDYITLPAGTYTVHYVTDDSHSFESWNEMPPFDPMHWGITVWAADSLHTATTIKPFVEKTNELVIVKLDHARDNQFMSAGFQLTAESTLRITALGEYSGARDAMVDYGWIVDARTRKTVWRMTYSETDYAGGGRKNRMFDGFVTLPAGAYIAFYRTDDSHAYRSWNEHEPWQPEAWGMAIRCAKKGCRPDSIKQYLEQDDPAVLARIVRVRNNAEKTQTFHLDSASQVKIFSVGEGRDGKMFDFGWIESEHGDEVWRMKFDDTRHAGGGQKNRLINEDITLQPGTYRVFFETDDSHSYGDWNTEPPLEFEDYWGITIIKQ